MRRTRALLAAAAVVATTAAGPARAAEPTVLVATHRDGSLVKVTLVGRLALAEPLVPAAAETVHVPSQAAGGAVAYTTWNTKTRRSDVGVVSVDSGARQRHSANGRTGQLLVSRDRKVRVVLRTNARGNYTSLVRLDDRGRARTLYAPDPKAAVHGDVVLSGASLTPDGRTAYVARTTTPSPSPIYAVDVATGRRRLAVRPSTSMMWVLDVVVSPDARTLAVSFVDLTSRAFRVRLVPVAGGAGTELRLPHGAPLTATAFSPDSSTVVLSTPSLRVRETVGTPGLMLGDVESGRVTPILGSEDLQNAVAVA